MLYVLSLDAYNLAHSLE